MIKIIHCLIVATDGEVLKNISRISRRELEAACEDFSNIIGTYPDSIVYKGTMAGGEEIAVVSLCVSKDQWTSYLEFYFQNKVISLGHPYLKKCNCSETYILILVANLGWSGGRFGKTKP